MTLDSGKSLGNSIHSLDNLFLIFIHVKGRQGEQKLKVEFETVLWNFLCFFFLFLEKLCLEKVHVLELR